MIRKLHSASFLTMAIVGGLALPAMASTPILSFADVDEAPSATISGNTATVANVTNLVAGSTAETDFDVVREGWFACDTATNFGFTGPTITSLILSGSTLNGISFTPPSVSGVWKCLSLDEAGSSVDLSTVDIWDDTGFSNVPYSTKAAQFPHIAYLGAYVMKTQSPTTTNMRLVTPQTTQYTPAPTVSTQPTISLGGDGKTLTTVDGAWSGGTVENIVLACQTQKVAQTQPTYNVAPSQCVELWDDSTPTPSGPPSDLSDAHTYNGTAYSAYDPTTDGAHVIYLSLNQPTSALDFYRVWSASVEYSVGSSAPAPSATPYTGPIVNPPSLAGPVARGGKVTLGGANLSGVTKVEINGLDCAVSVNSDGELEITVPAGLAAGTYDLVVTSSSGKLTVQDGIRVSADTASPLDGSDVRPSSKKNEAAGEVKVRVFDVAGAGKVQIFVNGKEIAWVNAVDETDSKLFAGYLVRTVSLGEGKTAIEVFVDGTRVQRWAYSQ